MIMLRNKIVKQALQQGFTSRSRWLLQILGLLGLLSSLGFVELLGFVGRVGLVGFDEFVGCVGFIGWLYGLFLFPVLCIEIVDKSKYLGYHLVDSGGNLFI